MSNKNPTPATADNADPSASSPAAPSKKPKPAANPTKTPFKTTVKRQIRLLFSWFLRTMAKLALASILALIIYLIYLDAKVTDKFEGQKWQIPAQVFAQPVKVVNHGSMTLADLLTELDILNYSQVDQITGPGEYKVTGNQLTLARRSFEFADGIENERWLTVSFDSQGIRDIRKVNSNKSIDSFRLEPLQLERILSAEQEDREFLPLEAFPERLKDTLLLIEDRNFYHHHGVSVSAILRALWYNFKAGYTVQGGSTLTQQLAKNFYLSATRNITRKINEAFIALILDFRYSKDQILEAYLNEVFLGQFNNRAVHGFGLASRYYFSKPVDELKANEYALLVALIKGPTFYNPRRHEQRALDRRDLVLRLMFENHLIDRNEYELAVNQPLGIAEKSQFKTMLYPAFIHHVKRQLNRILPKRALLSDGIKIFTTLDPRLQRATEQAISQQLPALEKQYKRSAMEAASVSVDIDSAAITAMVGGRDVSYPGFNRAVDMRRNIGSLIKPAVYLTALSQPKKYHLASLLLDQPISLKNQGGKLWRPENYSKKYIGQMPLLQALSQSQNVPTVNLGMALGLPAVTKSLQKLGVTQDIPQYPSLFLGALELSPLEVSQMYATIAGGGVYRELTAVDSVVSAKGDLIWQRPLKVKNPFSYNSIYLTNKGLIEVAKTGTARWLASEFPGVTLAGKTGTTDNLRDSWFSGFDGKTLSTFWVGKDNYSPVGLTGSQGALRLFAALRQQIPAKAIATGMPRGIVERYFSWTTGEMYNEACQNSVLLPMVINTQAARPCP